MSFFSTSSFYCPEYNQERGSYFGNPKLIMEKVSLPITSESIRNDSMELIAKVVLPIAKEGREKISGPWDMDSQSPKAAIINTDITSEVLYQ
jgi:hypothetical protein